MLKKKKVKCETHRKCQGNHKFKEWWKKGGEA